jgi:hypothetical protein
MPSAKFQHLLVGTITYVVLLVVSLFVAAVFWSCIAPDQFYHMYYDAPLVTFIPPFNRDWTGANLQGLHDYFIWSAWIVYALWAVFAVAAFALPALVVRVLEGQEKLNLKWFRNPTFIISLFSAIVILYVLSLGPLLWVCNDWEGLPRMLQHIYAPLYSWAGPQFDTAYGHYLMWWINLQYWRNW